MEYSLGFLFNDLLVGSRRRKRHVVLIRKKKPEWMYNLLSGVGCKIEPNESAQEAMVREFKEETGVETSLNYWNPFGVLYVGGDSTIHLFRSMQTIQDPKTMTEEEVGWYSVDSLRYRHDVYPNTHWLISMAIHDLHYFHQINVERSSC